MSCATTNLKIRHSISRKHSMNRDDTSTPGPLRFGLPLVEPPRKGILVVDDDPGVLDAVRVYLELKGYPVFTARNADQALRLWPRARREVRVVLVDVVLPGLQGPELVLQLATRSADVKVLYMSGHPPDRITHR